MKNLLQNKAPKLERMSEANFKSFYKEVTHRLRCHNINLLELEDIEEDTDYERYSENITKLKKSHLYTCLSRNDVIPTDVPEARHKLEHSIAKDGMKDGCKILYQLLLDK